MQTTSTRTIPSAPISAALAGEVSERRWAEAALWASEERLRTVVTNAPIILLAMDRSGTITFAEGRGLSAFALHPDQLLGRSIRELYAGDDLPAPFYRALAGETIVVDAENGEQIEINTSDRRTRTRFSEAARAQQAEIFRTLRRNSIDAISLRTGDDYLPALRAFFKQRELRLGLR